MFQLDDNFLEEVGLGELPVEQRKEFLEHVYSQLELRVGTRLSEGLSEVQISEFEAFVDRDKERVEAWVNQHQPNYKDDATYQQIRQSVGSDISDNIVLAEYASLKWLALNRPDYRDVVRQVLEELKQEIKSSRDAILGS